MFEVTTVATPWLWDIAALWVAGNADLLRDHRAVAVVGARACTAYGAQVATEIGTSLSRAGIVTVSGLAYGIDGAAHRAVVANTADYPDDGPTVAVLAGGLDRIYPAVHEPLAQRIVEQGGALVSAYPPGTVVSRTRFLARNRLIASLSSAMVVVEATTRSGSMNAAEHARDLGVPVYAVPGPLTSVTSSGTNLLLSQGARVLRGTDITTVSGILPG